MKRYKYRGLFDPDMDYGVGDYCLFEGRGYRLMTEDGWKAMVATADPSDRGPAGADGRPGRDGRDGKSIVGPVGPRGRDGADGRPGRDGRDGKRGRDGESGTGYVTVKQVAETMLTATADEPVMAGQVLYATSTGVALALADNEVTATAVGIAATSGGEVKYVVSGPVTNPDWNLTPGRAYYLSPDVAGGMTATFPNAVGNYVVILGVALTPTTLKVDIHFALIIGS